MGFREPLAGRAVSSRTLLQIAITAIAIHVAVFATVRFGFHISLDDYTDKGDGQSYKRMAETIAGEKSALSDYDTRVFPGYPMLIAATHIITRLPVATSALLVTFFSAGIAAAASAALFDNARIGWATVLLFPHAWINMSLAMSEAPVLALTMLGLLLAQKKSAIAGGILLGIAGLIRPMACFALLGLVAGFVATGRARRGSIIAVFSGAVVLGGMLFMHHLMGDSLHGVRVYANSPQAYDGQMFSWPGHSIIHTMLYGNVSVARDAYILSHALICIIAIALLFDSRFLRGREPMREEGSSLEILCLVWLGMNTLFILCIGLGPGAWGFNHFPRFMLPALPALLFAIRKWLPNRLWIYVLVSAGLFVNGVVGVYHCP